VTDVVRGPILRHALRDQAVQRQVRSPHDVGARLVVGGLGERDGTCSLSVSKMASAKRSESAPPAGYVKYCSMTWTKASAMPLDTCLGGSENVTSGSNTAKRGSKSGLTNTNFCPVSCC